MNKMTKESVEKVNKYIAYCIVDELKNLFKDTKFQIKELFNVVVPSIKVQWWYDIEFNKVYLYYLMDIYSSHHCDTKELYLRINSRLNNNFFKDTHLNVDLLDPSIRVMEGKRVLNNADSSPIYLRDAVFSYWRCGEKYRFIESRQRLHYEVYKDYIFEEDKDRLSLFNEFVLEINKKYDFINNNDDVIPAFEEFKTLYKEFFNRELFVIDPKDVISFSIDVYYFENEEEYK